MNKVILVGRLASDPQPYTTTTGKSQSKITIACNDSRTNGEAMFFPCVGWQQQANFMNSYLKKGDLVSLDGRLSKRSYVSKDGKNISVTEIIIDSINSLGKKNSESPDSQQPKKNNSYGSLKSVNESFPETVVGKYDQSKSEHVEKSKTSPEEVEWFDEVSSEE